MSILDKITPMPWVNDRGLVNGRDRKDPSQPSFDLYDAASQPGDMDEAFANAAIIAAAPAMYRALMRWRDFAKNNGWTDADHQTDGIGWITETKEALAQAEGKL